MPCTLSASVFRPGIPAQSAYCGWKDAAPFDKVIVPCGIDHIPPPLLMQLRPNGIMVIPTAPTADRRRALLDTRCKRSLQRLCGFSATPRHNLRAGKPKSSTAASALVDSQAL